MTINGISVGSGSVGTSGASIGQTSVANAVSDKTGTITVVITLSGASGTGTFRLDDFQLIGTVSAAASAPSVSSTAASSITATSATLGGNVTSDGGASVTDRGVVYKTSSGVTISDNKTQIGSGTGSFSQSISSLSVNTHYYFKAYATNSKGTTLGSELDFWTLANVPSAPTVGSPTSSSLNVAVNENSNPSSTEFAIKVTYGATTKYVQSNGALGDSAVWATKATWGTKTVTGLSSSTTYTFSVAARNGANTATAYGTTANGTTSASCGSYYHALYNRGTPLYSYYLGDKVQYVYEFALNQDTGAYTVEYGLGQSTGGSGWTWRAGEWSRMDGTENRVWKSKADEHQFTATGNWYHAGRFTSGSCVYYAD